MKRSFFIGGCRINWDGTVYQPVQDEFTERFLLSEQETNITETIVFRTVLSDSSFFDEADCVFNNATYELLETKTEQFLVYHWGNLRRAYGVSVNQLRSNEPADVFVNPKMHENLPLPMIRALSTVGLHSKLLQMGELILHSSVAVYHGKAIIFIGQSGAGKSTQARLWEKFLGAEIVNEDRGLLRRINDEWNVCGYPCSGSSKICCNKTAQIQAIVALEHSKKNCLTLLSTGESLRRIICGAQMFTWKAIESQMCFTLAERIVNDVPVYHFKCLPEESAVLLLERELFQ